MMQPQGNVLKCEAEVGKGIQNPTSPKFFAAPNRVAQLQMQVVHGRFALGVDCLLAEDRNDGLCKQGGGITAPINCGSRQLPGCSRKPEMKGAAVHPGNASSRSHND